MSEKFTGRHFLAWLGGFFLVMFAANGALIYFALHTLHGEALENSYDASQAFNKLIAERRAQDERGWKADVLTRAEGPGERVMVEFHDKTGAPISDLVVTARFEHPFDAGAGPQRVARLRRRRLRGGGEPHRARALDPGDRGEPGRGAPVPQREQDDGRGHRDGLGVSA